jgi:hypothetical protein
VERLEPDRLLVLRSTRHLPASWRQRGLAMDWIWELAHAGANSRANPGRPAHRMRLHPRWFERALLATIIPADFIMARSHLRGLQHRAQASTAEVLDQDWEQACFVEKCPGCFAAVLADTSDEQDRPYRRL